MTKPLSWDRQCEAALRNIEMHGNFSVEDIAHEVFDATNSDAIEMVKMKKIKRQLESGNLPNKEEIPKMVLIPVNLHFFTRPILREPETEDQWKKSVTLGGGERATFGYVKMTKETKVADYWKAQYDRAANAHRKSIEKIVVSCHLEQMTPKEAVEALNKVMMDSDKKQKIQLEEVKKGLKLMAKAEESFYESLDGEDLNGDSGAEYSKDENIIDVEPEIIEPEKPKRRRVRSKEK